MDSTWNTSVHKCCSYKVLFYLFRKLCFQQFEFAKIKSELDCNLDTNRRRWCWKFSVDRYKTFHYCFCWIRCFFMAGFQNIMVRRDSSEKTKIKLLSPHEYASDNKSQLKIKKFKIQINWLFCNVQIFFLLAEFWPH